MFSSIVLNKENLINNFNKFSKKVGGKICVMVKANAYGHGLNEVIKILQNEAHFFGVSNQQEGEDVREVCSTPVVVFGACDDYLSCMKKNISFALFSLKMAKKLTIIAKRYKLLPKFHLCVNSGMNRYGVKNLDEFQKIIKFLEKNNIELEGLYTHFSSLTTDEKYTKNQIEKFEKFTKLLPPKWKTIIHVGGGNSIFTNLKVDMHRIGLGIYGYGFDFVKPVMKIKSQIVDIQEVEQEEHIGYLCSFTAKQKMRVATIPLGYADGLARKLSNKIEVEIAGHKAKSCGNICMDAFMVDVTDIKCKIGDEVTIFDDATSLAKIIETSEYEVLTNFCKFRGNRFIE